LAAFTELLDREFRRVSILSPEHFERLYAHYELMIRWNVALNLTSVRSVEEIVIRHYCESLFLGVHLPPGPCSVMDVGSGAGFPGIPLAAIRPELRVTLTESHQRKAVFLREATREWPNVRVFSGRAEDLALQGHAGDRTEDAAAQGRPGVRVESGALQNPGGREAALQGRAGDFGQRFDWVVSRAVRWPGVLRIAANSVALLVGEQDAAGIICVPGFDWDRVLSLPWGARRVLIRGRKHSCST
jgi:16S rRNA G527 N7-methylase RsmG